MNRFKRILALVMALAVVLVSGVVVTNQNFRASDSYGQCKHESGNHDPECYGYCDKTEHTHGDECYDENGYLTCIQEEHTHNSDCEILNCQHLNGIHDDSCGYVAGNAAESNEIEPQSVDAPLLSFDLNLPAGTTTSVTAPQSFYYDNPDAEVPGPSPSTIEVGGVTYACFGWDSDGNGQLDLYADAPFFMGEAEITADTTLRAVWTALESNSNNDTNGSGEGLVIEPIDENTTPGSNEQEEDTGEGEGQEETTEETPEANNGININSNNGATSRIIVPIRPDGALGPGHILDKTPPGRGFYAPSNYINNANSDIREVDLNTLFASPIPNEGNAIKDHGAIEAMAHKEALKAFVDNLMIAHGPFNIYLEGQNQTITYDPNMYYVRYINLNWKDDKVHLDGVICIYGESVLIYQPYGQGNNQDKDVLRGYGTKTYNVKDGSGYTKDGYYFAGWSLDPNAQEPDPNFAYGNPITVQENETKILYGVWKQKTALIYDANWPTLPGGGASDHSGADTTKREKTGDDVTFTLEGSTSLGLSVHDFKFVGWSESRDTESSNTSLTEEQRDALMLKEGTSYEVPKGGTKTLYAQWRDVGNITVTYHANYPSGNTGTAGSVPEPTVSPRSLGGGKYVGNTGSLNAKRYEYVGWAKNSSVNGSEPIYLYDPNGTNLIPSTSNIDLYALWAPKFGVKYDGGAEGVTNIPGAEVFAGNTSISGDSINAAVTYAPYTVSSQTPEREGYVFTGWTLVRENGTEQGTLAPGATYQQPASTIGGAAEVITLRANWEKKFNVKFKAGDGNTVYDGANHNGTETSLTVVINGQEYPATKDGNNYVISNGLIISGIQVGVNTDAINTGTYDTVVTGTPIIMSEGENITKNCIIETPEKGRYTIEKRNLVLTSGSDEKDYDGKALTKNEVTADGLVGTDKLSYNVTGKQILVGESENTFDYSFDSGVADNYNIVKKYGTLKVTGSEVPKYSITISGVNQTLTYDGKEHVVNTYTINGQLAQQGFLGSIKSFFENFGKEETFQYPRFEITDDAGTKTYEVRVQVEEAKGTNAGEYIEKITGTQIWCDGKDVTTLFTVNENPGKLTINKAEVTVKAPSKEETYTGKQITLKASDYYDEILYEGAASDLFKSEKDKYDIVLSGEQTGIGTSPSRVAVALKGGNPDNYIVTVVPGALTVKKADNYGQYDIKVFGPSESYVYDGKDHTIKEFIIKNADGSESRSYYKEGVQVVDYTDADGVTYTITGITSTITEKNAGEYKVPITIGKLTAVDQNGVNWDDRFNATLLDGDKSYGKLTIEPIKIHYSTESQTWLFDGQVHSHQEMSQSFANASGYPEGEGFDWVWTDKDGNPSEVYNVGDSKSNWVIPVANENTIAGNYDIQFETIGTIKIISPDTKFMVDLVGNGYTGVYDGNTHEVTGFVGTEAPIPGISNLTGYPFSYQGKTYYVTGIVNSGSGKDAGSKSTEITGEAIFYDEKGNQIKDVFAVNATPGTINITPAKVTLKSGSAAKPYDGTALTSDNAEYKDGEQKFTATGFFGNDGVDPSFQASIITVGWVQNKYEYSAKAGTKLDNYEIVCEFGQLEITGLDDENKLEITLTGNSDNKVYDGQPMVATGFDAPLVDGKYEITVNGVKYYVDPATVTYKNEKTDVDPLNPGTITKDVTGAKIYDENGNDVTEMFKPIVVKDGFIDIKPRELTLTSVTLSKEFDGIPLTNGNNELVISDGAFVEGEGVTPTFTASILNPGNKTNEFTYVGSGSTKLSNYNITKVEGQLIVTKPGQLYNVDLKAKGGEKTYDGTALTLGTDPSELFDNYVPGLGYEVKTNLEGKFYIDPTSVTNTGSATNVSESGNTTVGGTPIVRNADGEDVTENFHVNIVPGTIKINPKEVKIVSASDEKPYDGTPLTKHEYTANGFVEGQGVTVTFSDKATVTAPRATASNEFTYEANPGTDLNNYKITTEYGTLKITPLDGDNKLKVEITGAGGEKQYDGNPLVIDKLKDQEDDGSIKVTINGQEYTITGVEYKQTVTDVDGTPEVTYNTENVKIFDKDGNDVTDQFGEITLNWEVGKLTPRKVILTSGDAEKTFDGTPLKNGDMPVNVEGDGFVPGEGVDISFVSSILNPGTVDNEFTYVDNAVTNLGNYVIETHFGKLTVNPLSEEDAMIILNGLSGEKTYDGTPLTVNGFEEEYVEGKGYKVSLFGQNFYVEGVTNTGEMTDVISQDGGPGGVTEGKLTTTNAAGVVVTTESGDDVTENFTVYAMPGQMVVHPRTVTLRSASDEKPYDGTALTKPAFDINEGWADGESASVTWTGEQTFVGESENTFDLDWTAANEKNYLVNIQYGTLKVIPGDDSKVIVKTHEGDPNRIYRQGDVVTFNVTVTNVYDQPAVATITEKEGFLFENGTNVMTTEELAPGSSITVPVTYTVTDADAAADLTGDGKIENIATVQFTLADGTITDSFEATDEVPVYIEKPSMFLTKNARLEGTETLIDASYQAKVGDRIEYIVAVTNNGNVDLANVVVSDEFTGDTWNLESLTKGTTGTFTTVYEVKASDILAGGIHNVAKATTDTKVPGVEDGDITAEATFDVGVKKDYRLVINYVDAAGNKLATSTDMVLNAGERYAVVSPSITGYQLVNAYNAEMAGVMPAQDVELNVVYDRAPAPTNPNTPNNNTPNNNVPNNNIPNNNVPNNNTPNNNVPNNNVPNNNVPNNTPADNNQAVPTPNAENTTAAPVNDANAQSTTPEAEYEAQAISTTPEAEPVPVPVPIAGNTITNPEGPEPGTIVNVDNEGEITFTPVDDVRTALADMNLDDFQHLCNILYFLILLASAVLMMFYFSSVKKHQKRIFELRKELGEDDPFRKEKK